METDRGLADTLDEIEHRLTLLIAHGVAEDAAEQADVIAKAGVPGGVNIYPAEIEAALHAVPGVHDCAVFGIPDDEFGEALMAVVEPLPGAGLDTAGIRAQLKQSLADYKVPKHIEIGTNLPREDSGKIFKRRLRDPYWERAGRKI